MKRLLLALAIVLAAGAANAETCTFPAGSSVWNAVTDAIDGTCTEDATDTFVIPAGAHVTTTGNITLSTGRINVTGGTLVHSCGTTISWTGATATGLNIDGAGAVYEAQGCVLWSGRVGSDVTYAAGPPQTAAFTIPLADISTLATTSDFVVFGDDDPTSLTAPIRTPVQIGPGLPTPGYHRPSYRKWAWHQIQTAPASSTLTIYTDDVTGAEGLTPDAYSGTYGPIIDADTAITGAPTRMTHGNGIFSQIVYGNTGALLDGDGMLQYVEFRSGACDGEMAKISWIDVDGGGAGVDHVYVFGDVTNCGSGVDARINYGIRNGDPIKIVRPAILAGANTVAGPQVFVTNGGSIRADFARFEYLDDSNAYDGGSAFSFSCNVCFFRKAGVDPDFDTSYLTNTALAFGHSGSADTAAIGGMGMASGVSGFFSGTTPVDATGLVLDRLYIHDQVTGVNATGVAGIRTDGFTNVTMTRSRLERIGDDAVTFFSGSFTGQEHPTNNTARHIIAGEIYENLLTSHSAQCFEGGSLSTAYDLANTSAMLGYRLTVSDMLGLGCADGGLVSGASLGGNYSRLAIGGFQSTNVMLDSGAFGSGWTALPAGIIASNPTIWRNAVVSMAGGATSSLSLRLAGELHDSVIAGHNQTTDRSIFHATLLSGVFANRGAASSSEVLERLTTAIDAFKFPLTTVRNSAFLSTATNASQFPSTNLANASYFTGIDLDRVFWAPERVGASGGFSNLSGTDTTQPLTADGLTISVVTQTTGGVGRGTADNGTAEGANITNACVEGTSLRTATAMFGAAVTDTSYRTMTGMPESTDDHNISAFVAQGGESICGNDALPARLGLSQFGVTHALLGDAFVRNVERVTTDRGLIRTITGGAGSGTGPNIR